MSHRLGTTVAALVLVAGCSGEAAVRSLNATEEAPCEIGQRPQYFVPGPDADEPIAIIGCARLGASGRPVEFSANAETIGRRRHLCINPAYRGRGQMGIYIPAVCLSNPVPNGLEVQDVRVPRQAVRDYGLVIWGSAPAATQEIVARQERDETAAAVFEVGPGLARAAGARKPFTAFVAELDPDASCAPIFVSARGPSGMRTERVIRNRCKAG
jgi:hypothetical protein